MLLRGKQIAVYKPVSPLRPVIKPVIAVDYQITLIEIREFGDYNGPFVMLCPPKPVFGDST
jgi:hypothetical protein